MNNLEARFILQAYRPNEADAGDPAFAEAFEQVRRDPALREWFQQELAFDRAISAQLAEVPPPPGLRDSILAGARLSSHEAPRLDWWRRPLAWAAAAAVAVLVGVGFGTRATPASAGELTDFALNDVLASPKHGGGTDEPTNALRATLTQASLRLGQPIAVNCAQLHACACRRVTCEGHEVFEVCFKRGESWFHCYIADRKDFPNLGLSSTPTLATHDTACAASWQDSAHVFVVVSRNGPAPLQQLL